MSRPRLTLSYERELCMSRSQKNIGLGFCMGNKEEI